MTSDGHNSGWQATRNTDGTIPFDYMVSRTDKKGKVKAYYVSVTSGGIDARGITTDGRLCSYCDDEKKLCQRYHNTIKKTDYNLIRATIAQVNGDTSSDSPMDYDDNQPSSYGGAAPTTSSGGGGGGDSQPIPPYTATHSYIPKVGDKRRKVDDGKHKDDDFEDASSFEMSGILNQCKVLETER